MTQETISSYNKRASSYEKKWKKYLNHTHEEFLSHVETAENDTILDVSGGTGLLAKMLLQRDYCFKHLIINDPSEKMLAIARSRLSNSSRLSFSNYRASKLPHPPNSFDRIFCLNSFHFYPNQPEILNRFKALLKPDGRLYILDWNRMGFFIIIHQILKWTTSEYIQAQSLPEIQTMLLESGFSTTNAGRWNWRYWNFFFIEATKSTVK